MICRIAGLRSPIALLPIALVLIGLVPASAAAQSTARTVRIQSERIGLRTVAVLLPANYEQTEKRYPVLYLLHGGGQDHTAYMARRDFARRARTVEMIVVMPGADRGGMPAGVLTQYEDFIAGELVPYIDANYRTTAAASTRAIGGLSMGGMIATGAGLRYPQVFGIVGAFSPAAPRAQPPAPTAGGQFFYVSCGTLDSLLPVSRQLVESLVAAGVAHEYQEVPGVGHSWEFWDPQVDRFFGVLAGRPGWQSQSAAAR